MKTAILLILKKLSQITLNQIYGNSLIVNSDKATNYILNNDTSGRFILINSNILGDFNGSNIFTTGCVLK